MERIEVEFGDGVAWIEKRADVIGYWSDKCDPGDPDEYRCANCGEEVSGWDSKCKCEGEV